ncbi:MAG: tetratricopeptide repeat protein [Acidobacteriaceae bacterium]
MSPEAILADARHKLDSGQQQQAITELQQLSAMRPQVKGLARTLGLGFYRTGKLVEADHKLAQAIAEDPSDLESIQLRGLTLYRLGQPAAAIPLLERVRQWMPNANADANYVLGLCYLNSQRYEDARNAFAKQYGVTADSGAAYLLLGGMLLRAHLPELAASAAGKAIERTPNLPLAHFMLGEVALFKSDVAGALLEFEKERALNPAYPAVYDRLGDAYLRAGKYEDAQEALAKAISLDVSSTGPFILMGKVLMRRNDPQTAILYLQHAEKMDSSNYTTHTLLGQAYRGVGRKEDASREIEIAAKINASNQLKLQPIE